MFKQCSNIIHNTNYTTLELYNQMRDLRQKDDYYVAYVLGTNCPTQRDLLKNLSIAFQFPKYAQYNWQSFHDYFLALNWLKFKGIGVVIDDYEQMLCNEPQLKEMTIRQLEKDIIAWRNSGIPCEIIINCNKLDQLPLTGVSQTEYDSAQLYSYVHYLQHNREYFVGQIQSINCKDKSELLKEMAAVFQFPNYFGYNWDALDECMRDLNWLKFWGVAIIFNEYDKLLKDDLRSKEQLLDHLNFVYDHWSQQGVPFLALLNIEPNS